MKKEQVKKMPDLEVEGWDLKELAQQSSNKESDEILNEVIAGKKIKPDSKIPSMEAFAKSKKGDPKLND